MSVKGFLDVARGQLGYVEGSNNDNKFGPGVGGVNHASWCDYFVSWCGIHANERSAVGVNGYCPDHMHWFDKAGRLTRSRNNVERGHIIFWDWNFNGDPNHVEIVETVSVDSHGTTMGVTTLGGNTGPNSDRVYRQYRTMAYFLSAGRPEFSNWKTAWPGKLLVKGSFNNAVGRFQEQLNKKGAKLKVDNDFGPATLAAVKTFQSHNKLTSDGQVGLKTWGKAFA